jgi:hypothetical protein
MSPKNEHEFIETIKEDYYYPDHAPRSETSVFRKTKHDGKAANLKCAISGTSVDLEYHHVFAEWAFTDAIDWAMVKKIATGEVKTLPVLDLKTDLPTSETFPVEQSLIWAITQLMAHLGFDWAAFDPEKPETIVDSMQNMLVINKKYHRSPTHGIHHLSLPAWIFQAFPRVNGFVFTKDELV